MWHQEYFGIDYRLPPPSHFYIYPFYQLLHGLEKSKKLSMLISRVLVLPSKLFELWRFPIKCQKNVLHSLEFISSLENKIVLCPKMSKWDEFLMINRNCEKWNKSYFFEVFISLDILLMWKIKIIHKKDLKTNTTHQNENEFF